MTTNDKIITWGLVAVIIIALIVAFRNQIANLWNNLTAPTRTINTTTERTTVVQPIIYPVNPVYPPAPPQPKNCTQLKGQMDVIKAKINATSNPYQKAQLQKMWDNLNQQYIKMGCVGPPPPPNTQM